MISDHSLIFSNEFLEYYVRQEEALKNWKRILKQAMC